MTKWRVVADVAIAIWAAMGLLLVPLAIGFGGWANVMIPTADNILSWIFMFGGWVTIAFRAILALIKRMRTTTAP